MQVLKLPFQNNFKSFKVDTEYFRWQFSNSFFSQTNEEISIVGEECSSQDDYRLKFEHFYNI